MTRQKGAVPLDQPPLSPDERALLRTLATTIRKSSTPVQRPTTKFLRIGPKPMPGPFVEVKFDWPDHQVKPLVDLLVALGRASDTELNSLATNLAVLLVDNGWTKAKATRTAVASVKKLGTAEYGRAVPNLTTARNLAKNLSKKL